MWSDNETATDLIGFDVHASLLRAVITDHSMLPLTVGVFGDWGGGKTSIMKMLEKSLDPDTHAEGSAEHKRCSSIATVYVNTWQFEGYDDAKAALISAVLLELDEHQKFGPKVRKGIQELLRWINVYRLGRLTFKHVALPAAAAYVTGGAAAIPYAVALSAGVSGILPTKDGAEKAEPAADEAAGPDASGLLKTEDSATPKPVDVRAFKQQFSQLLKEGGITTLVVLVDDLDRCTPERLLENLEAIKLFLAVEQAAFVIGADPRIVQHAIRHRYAERATSQGSKLDTDRLVIDYLEKLVQLPYTLPRLSPSEIESYMALLFCQKHLADDQFRTALGHCETSRTKDRYHTFGHAQLESLLGKDVVQGDLATALKFCANAAPAIADGLKGNPRQVKRFLNAFLLRKELAKVARLDDIRDDVLVKLMILEYAHLERFRELFDWQAAEKGFPKSLRDSEATLKSNAGGTVAAGWDTPSLRRWLEMEPQLSTVDLRNYFWVARDRLETTLTGVALIPPLIRRLLEDSMAKPKRVAAADSAKGLSADERTMLYSLLEQHLAVEPEKTDYYEALRYFVELDVPGAIDAYVRVLTNADPKRMPPAVALSAVTLSRTKTAVGGQLHTALEHLREQPDSRAGAAVKNALSKGKA